jgi:hypothetical protein
MVNFRYEPAIQFPRIAIRSIVLEVEGLPLGNKEKYAVINRVPVYNSERQELTFSLTPKLRRKKDSWEEKFVYCP